MHSAAALPRTADSSDARPRVLVLGAGFLGVAVARALMVRRCDVRVVTRSAPNDERASLLVGASLLIGDAARQDVLREELKGVDHVVFALGSASPAQSSMDPAADVVETLLPLVRLLELLRVEPGTTLTFLSSGGTVYGDAVPRSRVGIPRPFPEATDARPVSNYGLIKLTSEFHISMYRDVHKVPSRILRIANVYGPGQPASRGQGLIAHLCQAARASVPLPLYGSPAAVRDFVYVDDVATAVAELVCAAEVPPIVNIGSGQGHSIGEVIELFGEITGTDIVTQSLPARRCDVRANVLDISLLRQLLPYEPTDLRIGLELTWKAALDADRPDASPSSPWETAPC